jgi:hypothetical protein
MHLNLNHTGIKSDIGKWLKTFFGLSYLDSSDVADCFAFDILLDAPDDEKAMEFVDCILNTYVDDNTKFSRQIWADPGSLYFLLNPRFVFSDTMSALSEADMLLLLRLVKLNAQLHERRFQNLNASKSKSYRYQCRKYCSLEV